MHGRRSGAAALPATLLPLLLLFPASSLGASPAIADRAMYIRDAALGLSAAAACGDKGSLTHCFRNVPEYVEADDLERCFRNAGCTSAESTIEAAFIINNFHNGKSVAELRRRGPEPVPAPTPAPTPAPAETGTSSATATGGVFTPTIECSSETTTKATSCPIQSTGSESGQTLPCFETEVPTSVCKAENFCSTDKDGNNLCMLRHDTLDVGEIIVTVFLATIFGLGFATLLFFCCTDKIAQRKKKARAEAAAIAKTAYMNAVDEETAIPPKREPSVGTGGQNPFADSPYVDASQDPSGHAPSHH
ncbi:hypothetical protein F5Y00DRAFT_252245 [Daldinia vernicosa]|uniref:uncharacterized protein n=1 Tax=Daldinia vernicosa TaxID=114800 RepID=UPI002008A634|nr:uncharacterized protein F5Y00DRAFT_252245 [Daldinia vernicosa]KAI0850556.1 hypothetical protein F5Y00DRAFT_252245 [Daldinia vernicosa]